MMRASTSLPVPDSPVISTGIPLGAASVAMLSTRCMACDAKTPRPDRCRVGSDMPKVRRCSTVRNVGDMTVVTYTPPAMKFAVVTFGCRVNQADSFALERGLRVGGGSPAPVEAADVVIVNSCSVTASADQGTRQAIRRIARTNADARIVATGCYASRAAEEVAALPGVVAVVPNVEKEALAERILDTVEPTTAERFGGGDGACGAPIRPGERGRTAYTLRVQTGCDEACAYCIIPSTRGRGRSVALPRVLDEVDEAVAAGYRELQLTGVHLGSYGRDLTPPSSLVALLRALAGHPADFLLRMSSLEPMDCTPEVVDIVTGSPRFAPHFHLPLQHRQRRDPAADAAAVHGGGVPDGDRRHPRAPAARRNRVRRGGRVPRRD